MLIAQLCLTLSDPMDYSLLGSSVHGILQARRLERAAISFSNMQQCVCVNPKLLTYPFPTFPFGNHKIVYICESISVLYVSSFVS